MNVNNQVLLNIITSVDNFEDLNKLTGSSCRIYFLCKNYRNLVSKKILKNMGYNIFYEGINPCKILVTLNSTGVHLNKIQFKKLVFSKEQEKNDLARFLWTNKEQMTQWLYEMVQEYIRRDNFNAIEKLYQNVKYDFTTPYGYTPLLIIAAIYSRYSNNLNIVQFILDHGGSPDELDYSEYWEDSGWPADLLENGGLRVKHYLTFNDVYEPALNLITRYINE